MNLELLITDEGKNLASMIHLAAILLWVYPRQVNKSHLVIYWFIYTSYIYYNTYSHQAVFINTFNSTKIILQKNNKK